MTPKRSRLIAMLILWIGIALTTVSCIFTLLLAQGNPMNIPTSYVPTYVDFIFIGLFMVAVLVTAIVLYVTASRKERRDRIREAWESAHKEADELADTPEIPAEVAEMLIDPASSEEELILPVAEAPVVAEDAPAPVAEAVDGKSKRLRKKEKKDKKPGKVRAALGKLPKKVPVSGKQVAAVVATAVAIAVPAAIMGAKLSRQHSKIKSYQKKEKNRKEFYEWLG